MLFWVCFFIFLGLVAVVALSLAWPMLSARLKAVASAPATFNAPSPMVGIPDSQGDMRFFDITPAAPCDTTNHGCKFVAIQAERCLLTEAENAVKTLSAFAPRAKKISTTVRGTLQQSFDFTAEEVAEAEIEEVVA